MALSHSLVPLTCFMLLLVQAMAQIDPNWYDARATFYGDAAGGETMRKLLRKKLCFTFTSFSFINIKIR
jgi:hypothetical protein